MLQGRELRDTCLGSATAGMVSRLLCHPLDTAKARLQGPDGGPYKNTLHVVRTTIASEGFGGLYRGLGAVIVGGVPGTCLYLTTYEATKGSLAEWGSSGENGEARAEANEGTFLTHLTAGMIAEIVCCIVYVPVDIVKERLQIQQSSKIDIAALEGSTAHGHKGGSTKGPAPYAGSLDALRTILRTEGLRGIYKGYAATVGSFGPFSALYFMLYEQAKAGSQQVFHRRAQAAGGRKDTSGEELPVVVTLANAAAASAAASWVTNPLDLAKLRLQVQRGTVARNATSASEGPGGTVLYKGMLDALGHIYRTGGLRSLFKGSGARMAFHAPTTAIAMATFEKAKGVWGSLLD